MPSGGAIALPKIWLAARAPTARCETVCVAAAGLEAHVHAVAVEVLALAGEADHRVPELLVVLHAGRERRRAIFTSPVGRTTSRRALGRQVGLRQQLAAVASTTLARGRPSPGSARSTRPPSSSGHELRAPARSTGTRRRSSPASRWTPGRISRANARVGGNAALSASKARVGVRQRRRRAARIDALQVAGSRGERRHRAVEVRDQVLELRSRCASSAVGGAARARDQPRQVVRLGAEQRVVDDRRASQRARRRRRARR